jgi:hypothetical protein
MRKKSTFENIKSGLEEAIAFTEGKEVPGLIKRNPEEIQRYLRTYPILNNKTRFSDIISRAVRIMESSDPDQEEKNSILNILKDISSQLYHEDFVEKSVGTDGFGNPINDLGMTEVAMKDYEYLCKSHDSNSQNN